MKGSLLIEAHCWRGFKTGTDLFDCALTIGWLTFYVSKASIAESIKAMKASLARAKRALKKG